MVNIVVLGHSPRHMEVAKAFNDLIKGKNHKSLLDNQKNTNLSHIRKGFKKSIENKLHNIKPGKIY